MENSPRVLAGDNAPDLIRLPSISDLVKDGLLKNLDGYVTAFGWDKYPPAELAQNRVADGGRPRGQGSLYAMGLNYSMTGIFYNKTLAKQIGMTKVPETVAELEDLMAKAKAAGIQPIVQWNKPNAGLAFPLQNLMGAFGPPGPINDWIFQRPGATIDTPSNLEAAKHLEQWIKAGYFPSDANAIDYATGMSRFIGGKGLLLFNGDWESGNLDKQMAGNAGFFLMPPAEAGGKHAAMSAPLTYGIGAKAKHPDCAAFFLNWVSNDTCCQEDQRRGRWLQSRRAGRSAHAGGRSRQRDGGHPGGRNGHRQGRRRDGLHRQRHRRDLLRWLDAGTAADGRRSPGCRRPCSRRCRPNTRRNFRAKLRNVHVVSSR